MIDLILTAASGAFAPNLRSQHDARLDFPCTLSIRVSKFLCCDALLVNCLKLWLELLIGCPDYCFGNA
jgi:hypothetical protein